MTRVEYIRQLEFSLNGKLSRHEISEILRDYSEYFDEGKATGKTEEEISINLGIPFAVAAQILSENEGNRGEDEKVGFWASWWEKRKGQFTRIRDKVQGLFQRPRSAPRAGYISPGALWTALLAIALFPPAVLALLFGALALGIVGAGLAFMALCLLLAAIIGAGLALATGSVAVLLAGALPGNALILLCLAVIGLLAGSVLAVCLCAGLMKALTRMIQSCLGRPPRRTARDPAWRALSHADGAELAGDGPGTADMDNGEVAGNEQD